MVMDSHGHGQSRSGGSFRLLTLLEREVVHHLQASHHQQVGLKVLQLLLKVLQGSQVRVVVIAVDDVPAGARGEHSVLACSVTTLPSPL